MGPLTHSISKSTIHSKKKITDIKKEMITIVVLFIKLII